MMSTMTIERPLTIPQIAALYGVTRQAVDAWIASGRLTTVPLSARRVGVTWDALRRFDGGLPEYKRRLRDH